MGFAGAPGWEDRAEARRHARCEKCPDPHTCVLCYSQLPKGPPGNGHVLLCHLSPVGPPWGGGEQKPPRGACVPVPPRGADLCLQTNSTQNPHPWARNKHLHLPTLHLKLPVSRGVLRWSPLHVAAVTGPGPSPTSVSPPQSTWVLSGHSARWVSVSPVCSVVLPMLLNP